jgi:hypothetical protein
MAPSEGWGDVRHGSHLLTVELSNGRPVDLVDLTTSLSALAQDFEEFSNKNSQDPIPGNLKLYVREMRSGSIIADLMPLGDQLSWMIDHKDLLGAFVGHLNDLAQYFLAGGEAENPPSRQDAERFSQILEPVSKDNSAQYNIQATDYAKVEIHNHFHVGFVEANAIQNGVRRFLGPAIPAIEIVRDRLLTLEQVKNVASAKTGDRGIIESVWPKAVKLQFLSETAKQQVLSLAENPFQRVFLVDAEVHAANGRPALYRIIEVKDIIET